ncbi:hypothetical protein [Bacillus sp. CDB3]|uniref:hypothetical protein n=1 Tax=Bacillus sp. CDB3 TaxID=360310 RepID=UPI0009D7FF19|nr:hypothetical protein [Bacillus sp. CDB3]OQR53490.1 hypothetical protein CDB3_29475 [Bacillus sp. CDB3]
MRVMVSTNRFNLATARQIVGLKRMWFITFGKGLVLTEGITQGEVRELYSKIYSHTDSRQCR